jgi:hypothetical protein
MAVVAPIPEGEGHNRGEAEGGLPPHHARGIADVLPHIAQQRAGCSGGDRLGRSCLLQWRHVLRQQVPFPELGKRQARGFVVACSGGDQFAPAILEMLRELFDNLLLASG